MTDEPDRGEASSAAPSSAGMPPRPPRPRLRSILRLSVQLVGLVLILALVGGIVLYFASPDGAEFRHRWPKRTAYMRLRIEEARRAGRPLEIRYRPVPLSEIPRAVQRAVLVAEDAGFYGHGAFDWSEMRAAVEQAWKEREAPRGASTITQQLARNLYLSPKRTLWRKVREAFIAVRLEHALSKRRILELYLNVIELGRGVFGVEAASEYYFGEPVSDVDRDQAVRLAATIPSPLYDNPGTDTREFRWRTGLIGPRAFAAESTAADTGLAADTTPAPPSLPAPDTAALPADTLRRDTTAADTLRPDTLPPDTLGPRDGPRESLESDILEPRSSRRNGPGRRTGARTSARPGGSLTAILLSGERRR